MTKKQGATHVTKEYSENKATVAPKQEKLKRFPLRADSGALAKNGGKTAASSMKPKAVQPPLARKKRALATAVPEGPRDVEAVQFKSYEQFMNLLTELADAELSNTNPEICSMGLYYEPPSN